MKCAAEKVAQSNVRGKESRSMSLLEEKLIALLSEAETEQNRMKQAILEQNMTVASIRMNPCAAAHCIRAPMSEESQALRGSIAKHESA